MYTQDEANALVGATAYDEGGQKVGQVTAVYQDEIHRGAGVADGQDGWAVRPERSVCAAGRCGPPLTRGLGWIVPGPHRLWGCGAGHQQGCHHRSTEDRRGWAVVPAEEEQLYAHYGAGVARPNHPNRTNPGAGR